MGKLFFALAATLAIAMVLDAGAIDSKIEARLLLGLIDLGSIDGKSYYLETEAYDWHAANGFCGGLGLRLAQIKSVEQHNFLVSKHPILGIGILRWVGARNHGAHENFKWEGTFDQVSIFQGFEPRMALAFHVSAPTVGILYEYPVDVRMGVLCESY